MKSEESKNPLIISDTGGLIRRIDHRLELMNRVLGEIAERKTEIIAAGDSFIGMRAGEERDWQIAPGVKMAFCWIPSGDFVMGSHSSEKDRESDEKQVMVTLSKGFWLAKREVIQDQWQAVMGSNPSSFTYGGTFPVDGVSWNDAQEFIQKVNASVTLPIGWKLALPTEAQWEYACRAGESSQYSGGTINQEAWHDENSGDTTHNVGFHQPNAWGLHDMHGTVLEWCADWYADALAGGSDPKGPASGDRRVIRGSSWARPAADYRAAERGKNSPDLRHFLVGFRPALIPSE
jgi:formylglycine-generating enzyme required for sulfatase activity